MKNKILILFLFFFTVSINSSFSQLVGSNENSSAPSEEIKAASITEGAFSDNISLFTGTYNSSYTLVGIVGNEEYIMKTRIYVVLRKIVILKNIKA